METCVVDLSHAGLGEDHDIDAGQALVSEAEALARTALDSIAVNGTLGVLLGDGQAEPRGTERIRFVQQQQMRRRKALGILEDALEIPGSQQALVPGKILVRHVLRRQTLAALGATALQHEAAVLGGHAATETVHALAMQFAGLESTFHGCSHLFNGTF